MTADSPLTILLIEDNPGDARIVREFLRDAPELSERTVEHRDDPAAGDTPTVVHETRLEDGLERLAEKRPDVVLLDLNLPDSVGIETLTRLRQDSESVPVVVFTGVSDQAIGLEALRRGAEEYLVKDEVSAALLNRSIHHALERKAHERELEQQREQLAALNHLNAVVQEVTNAVIEQSTREEIEQAVCTKLVESDSYELAWVGEVDNATEAVAIRAQAGDDGYLEDLTVSADPDNPRGQGPGGRAIRTREMQVVTAIGEDPRFEPWSDRAEEYGYRSSAAIPIVHEETLYGILGVYATRPHAFEGEERTVIGQVGEIVGHAIAAVERKHALISDEVVELDLQIPGVFRDVDTLPEFEDRIVFERVVPDSGDEFLLYGSASPADVDTAETLVDEIPHWDVLRIIDETDDRVAFELQQTGSPVLAALVSRDGYVEAASLEGGSFYLTVHLPSTADPREFFEGIQRHYPEASIRARRQVRRADADADVTQLQSILEDELTDRQRTVIETAYFTGYFEWPRESSGEELAQSLDITPATLSQHIRRVENEVFGGLFDSDRNPGHHSGTD